MQLGDATLAPEWIGKPERLYSGMAESVATIRRLGRICKGEEEPIALGLYCSPRRFSGVSSTSLSMDQSPDRVPRRNVPEQS